VVIKCDFKRTVLIQELATSHRGLVSLLDHQAVGCELEDLALVGAGGREVPGFAFDRDQFLTLLPDVIWSAGQPVEMRNQRSLEAPSSK